MSKFICKNEKCKNFEKEIEINDMNWPYELESKRIEDMQCKECGEQMKAKPFISKNETATHLKFNSLSSDDKKKVLKKRAATAYKKDGGMEKKMLKQRETISKMKK